MKKYRYLICFFALSAAALSCVASAMIAFSYCDLYYRGIYEGASAPASTAFLYLIPFIPAIIVCASLALLFHKKNVIAKKNKRK